MQGRGKRESYNCVQYRALGAQFRNLNSYPVTDKKSINPSVTPHWKRVFPYPEHPYPKQKLLPSHSISFLSPRQTLLPDSTWGRRVWGPPLGQLGSAILASSNREPGGFSQDSLRYQVDHQQTLGHGSPSKEIGKGLGAGIGQWGED
jgi:hypothetical protein